VTAENILRRIKVVSGEECHNGSQDCSSCWRSRAHGFWEIKSAFGIHTHEHNH